MEKLKDLDSLLALLDLTDDISVLARFLEGGKRLVRILLRNDGNHADAHIEGVEHVVLRDVSDLLDLLKDRQHPNLASVDERFGAGVERARNVFIKTAAGDVDNRFDLDSRKILRGFSSSSNTLRTSEKPLE